MSIENEQDDAGSFFDANVDSELTNKPNLINQEQCAIRAVRLNFPVITEANIELWFIQLDHWFIANDIRSDSQKFSTVIASMTTSMLQQVYDG